MNVSVSVRGQMLNTNILGVMFPYLPHRVPFDTVAEIVRRGVAIDEGEDRGTRAYVTRSLPCTARCDTIWAQLRERYSRG